MARTTSCSAGMLPLRFSRLVRKHPRPFPLQHAWPGGEAGEWLSRPRVSTYISHVARMPGHGTLIILPAYLLCCQQGYLLCRSVIAS